MQEVLALSEDGADGLLALDSGVLGCRFELQEAQAGRMGVPGMRKGEEGAVDMMIEASRRRIRMNLVMAPTKQHAKELRKIYKGYKENRTLGSALFTEDVENVYIYLRYIHTLGVFTKVVAHEVVHVLLWRIAHFSGPSLETALRKMGLH